MKKIFNRIFFVFIFTYTSTFTFSIINTALAQESWEKKYEDLKNQNQEVVADRDNLLIQIKNLYEYKNKFDNKEADDRKVQIEKDRLQKELQARLEQSALLQQRLEELESAQAQLVQEKENLKNSLEKIKIEYRIVPETRKKIADLQKENTDLIRRFKILEQKVKLLDEQKLDAYAQVEIYRRQLNDSKKLYEGALAKNRSLEQKIAQIPAKFAELARENKVLIKETALMHYNLGVFYTQSKEFSRATAEFEKAIELNPDDPYSHYNLGYIYAEYLGNRPKAIENFRKFLKLAKAEDKDVDWVKKYILTWQTWEGKKPVD
ncbi:MAG: tetratricopeptide repeat protein [Candidatus Omnitrophota bacterium]|nr:tetratricopeptide repeat protein [Candidatus Omnitrophota bacterium]MBU1928453.1 tetratricopeptide repeat protein [Candidatus Omnitrophota bacterium]MBU2035474.1 tetratricopeptide repeat protein [Candidatus Omnitrophota bacterium]MBU2258757.1 tetratricopeptide repeat protein [Candidatus Omnitrophota bacterium]